MPALIQRMTDYVLGPNQDARLASVAAGATITGIVLSIDNDAPFVVTGRALRCSFLNSGTLNQNPLVGLKTRWTDAARNYRQTGGLGPRGSYVLESLQSAYYGQFGNPKPIVPAVIYPPGSVIELDLKHTGSTTIPNLTFYFRGYELYPEGSMPTPPYPKRMASLTFAYPIFVKALGVSELRQNNIFTVKQDADFVIRGGQSFVPFTTAGRTLAEVAVMWKDANKRPYSNDFIPLDVFFGYQSGTLATMPVSTATLIPPWGTGPGLPGLFYPEIYVPANQQFLFDLYRTDGSGGSNQSEDFTFNLIGGKVFSR